MKALTILLLTVIIFGSGAYATWAMFIRKQQAIAADKAQPPPPPPPDPTLADFAHCQQVEDNSPLPVVRDTWRDFVTRFPQSSKIEEAKTRLGQLNSALLFSGVQTPEKVVYIVQKNDVITRVAAKNQSTPELIMRVNGMQQSMLRIGQRLLIVPTNFSLTIDRRHKRVVLLQDGKFFRQYPIVTMPAPHGHDAGAGSGGEHKPVAATPRPPKITGRVSEKIAWLGGNRVMFSDKGFHQATHWITISPAGHSLYTESGVPAAATGAAPQKPPGGGYGLAPDAMEELAALLRPKDVVTID